MILFRLLIVMVFTHFSHVIHAMQKTSKNQNFVLSKTNKQSLKERYSQSLSITRVQTRDQIIYQTYGITSLNVLDSLHLSKTKGSNKICAYLIRYDCATDPESLGTFLAVDKATIAKYWRECEQWNVQQLDE